MQVQKKDLQTQRLKYKLVSDLFLLANMEIKNKMGESSGIFHRRDNTSFMAGVLLLTQL